MKITKTKSSSKIKLSKKEWENIGSKSGWLNKMAYIKAPSPQELLSNYSTDNILMAIKHLGEESLCGFSGVEEKDIKDVIPMMEEHELGEIRDWIETNKRNAQMKFNLKSTAKNKKPKEGDIHYNTKLENEHTDPPNYVTQKQLDRDRVEEKNCVLESLLENSRTGSVDSIIEKSLNDSKSKLHKHRNTKAYTGAMNKVEEQRLSKARTEDEKYELASGTPPKKRWWEDLKVKTSSANVGKNVSAQAVREMVFDNEQSWENLDKSDRWIGEEGVLDDGYENKLNDFNAVLDEDASIEEVGAKPLEINEIKPIDTKIAKGLYIAVDVTPQGSQLGIDELQQKAYELVVSEGFGYLADIDDFTPDSFSLKGDQLVAPLVGDQYHPQSHREKKETSTTENLFHLTDLQETDVEGVFIGQVSIDPEMMELMDEMDDSDIIHQVQDIVDQKHPDMNIEKDAIDLDNISSGTITFVGQSETKTQSRFDESLDDDFDVEEIPSEDYDMAESFASDDFNIVVLSDTKKK